MAFGQVIESKSTAHARRSDDELMLIDGAKALLIARCSLSEAQAHRCLQKLSMETSRPMTVVAQQVIDLLSS